MLLGIDFDNTIVKYESLFHQLALEKGLIKETFATSKVAIRDYLRRQGKEEEFTLLQGEVYGLRILEAEPAEGMLEALKELNDKGVQMVVVSHKTRTPYKGPKYDLREGAREWLRVNGFFDETGLSWNRNQVIFEDTKEKKANTIKSIGCTHYIDDLPEILQILPKSVKTILYDPEEVHKDYIGEKINNWNSIKGKILANG